jgi:hypothetical protein
MILILGSSQLLVTANAQQDNLTMILNPGVTVSDNQSLASGLHISEDDLDSHQSYQLSEKWGIKGFKDGQFVAPRGISIDPVGNVFVVDGNNDRIQKFDNNGTFITKWGTSGTGDGQFSFPYGIARDPDSNFFVADLYNQRIQKFDNNGTFITKWGSNGTGDGQFISPHGITVDKKGDVYVTDYANYRVQKFDNNGTFITKWGSNGTGDGQFYAPMGIAIDSLDNVFVVDVFTDRVQKFDSNGAFITSWYNSINSDSIGPKAITTDSSNSVYVTDPSNNIIQKFDNNGTIIGNATLLLEGSIENPIAAGPDSIFVVVKQEGGTLIHEFDNNLNYISTFDVNDLKSELVIGDIYVDSNNTIFATLTGEGYGKELIGVNTKLVKLVPQPYNASSN